MIIPLGSPSAKYEKGPYPPVINIGYENWVFKVNCNTSSHTMVNCELRRAKKIKKSRIFIVWIIKKC
jgi:hypothetical protein